MAEARRYAVVEDGTVTNVVMWDGATKWAPGAGQAVPCPDDVEIGWLWDGGSFQAGPEAAPNGD